MSKRFITLAIVAQIALIGVFVYQYRLFVMPEFVVSENYGYGVIRSYLGYADAPNTWLGAMSPNPKLFAGNDMSVYADPNAQWYESTLTRIGFAMLEKYDYEPVVKVEPIVRKPSYTKFRVFDENMGVSWTVWVDAEGLRNNGIEPRVAVGR